MALIECGNCGAKVSDSCEKCIHCGHSLKSEVVVIEKVDSVPNESENLIVEVPIYLEGEFLEKNKSAMKYRRRLENCNYFGKCGTIFWIAVLFFFIMRWTSFLIKNKELCMFTLNFTILVGIVGLGMMIFTFVYKKIMNREIKVLIYHKMLQKWLKEEKNITYTPRIISEKDRNRFEKMDLNYYKL